MKAEKIERPRLNWLNRSCPVDEKPCLCSGHTCDNIHIKLSVQQGQYPFRSLINELFERIKHGDKEHQAWLKNEMEGFLKEKGF